MEAVPLHEVPYVYRENTSRQVSAKTRSWERAEERAQEIRDSWSPVKALQRELEAKVRRSEARDVLITDAVALFLQEVERLNREEATRAKYRLTLEDRLLNWCAQQKPPCRSSFRVGRRDYAPVDPLVARCTHNPA